MNIHRYNDNITDAWVILWPGVVNLFPASHTPVEDDVWTADPSQAATFPTEAAAYAFINKQWPDGRATRAFASPVKLSSLVK